MGKSQLTKTKLSSEIKTDHMEELTINTDFDFFKNIELRGIQKADHLDQIAYEVYNLAAIWKEIAGTVLTKNIAVAQDNTNWLRLIEQPEWTIYSKNIPKSRLENLCENLSGGNGTTNRLQYAVCSIGSILQKRKITKEIIEEDLKLIRQVKFFDKKNRIHEDMSIDEATSLMLSEAEAITAFAKQFRSRLINTSNRLKSESQVFSSIYKVLFLKKITDEDLLEEFRKKYVIVSGLNVSLDFLKKGAVYAAFNIKNRMCGGFVLGNVTPYRTIEVFAGEESKKNLYELVQGTSYCELNCFWLSVKNRKGFWSYWFWLLFAFKVSMRKEKMLIYGTIAKSLANIYGYPKKSKLLHTEELMFDGKMRTSWIFTGARTDFFVGVLETFIYKLKNKNKKAVKRNHAAFPAPATYNATVAAAN